MHSADRHSQPERRSSTRRSARLSTEDPFSDDGYDLSANVVSDGFRPTSNNRPRLSTPTTPPQARRQLPNLPRSPPPVAPSPLKGFAGLNRPSSTSKPPRLHDSLTLRNDGLASGRMGASSSSSSSTQGDVPYNGSTQPSHPYQMYPQRTYSNATSSSGPSSETLVGAQHPTHPYALYTQSTATADDTTQHHIPVGFNGMGNGYRRQIGPDGEDAGDLIGPLGHMEELPPYTRYPQESFQNKPENDGENSTAPVTASDEAGAGTLGLTTSSTVQPIPGAGGIGLATRNPEFSSTEDLSALPQRSASSIRSRSSLESYHQINGAAQDFAEKPSPSKWQRRAKKKLWGIVPYWAICLLLSGIVIMGIVMGTVIGTIVTRHNDPSPKVDGQYDKDPSTTTNIEFLPRQPHGLPPLATGCFALPPMDKYQVPKACIKNSNQTPAWSCDMPFRWYSMNVTKLWGSADTCDYAMKLGSFDPAASRYIYGTQPPDIPDFKPMWLVKDTEEANRGPAWFLEVKYNKTVLVREDQLTPPGKSNSKRHWGHLKTPFPMVDNSRFMKKSLAAAEGDKPWICTWPSITLQVFIYPNQTFTPSKTSSLPGPSASNVLYHGTPTPTPDDGGSPQPKFKEPYPKLVKFVERRPSNAANYAPATCTQYTIVNDGQDKKPVIQDGKPVTITIEEVAKNTKGLITERSNDPSRELSSLEDRGVDLTPCGCVSFSWSV